MAQVLIHSEDEPDRCRETVARFRQAYARDLCTQGDVDSAKDQVRQSVVAWEPIRAEIVEDDGLEAVW